jgi:AcrR family transcriptional regulator
MWSDPSRRVAAQAPLLPPEATSDGTVRRIQEVALVRFAERGFHGVSVRTLAEEVGLRGASIYTHFRSKEDLLHGLIELGHRVHHQALRAALLEADARPEDQLVRLMRAHVTIHARYALLATVANNELTMLSPERRESIVAMRLDSQRMFTEVVERGIELGSFKIDDPWMAIAAMGAIGIRVSAWFVEGEPYTVEQVAETYGTYALKLVT